jgi:hypothetical protein
VTYLAGQQPVVLYRMLLCLSYLRVQSLLNERTIKKDNTHNTNFCIHCTTPLLNEVLITLLAKKVRLLVLSKGDTK